MDGLEHNSIIPNTDILRIMPKARKTLVENKVTEMKIDGLGIYYALSSASPFPIIREYDDHIEVEAEIEEIENYFGIGNPDIEYISEFKPIKYWE